MITITIVNRSTVLDDSAIRACLPAFEAQANEDVCPAWGVEPVSLSYMTAAEAGHDIVTGTWPLYVMDNSDQAGALGYHEDEQGRVSGRVFAADCMRYGASWTVDLTHELSEMLGDPKTDQIIRLPGGCDIMRELCDAVEDETCAYYKKGVLVTDFCLSSYFTQGAGPFDFCNHLKAAAPTLTPGGYLGVYDPASGSWMQITARHRNGMLSRRSQRRGRSEWRVGRLTAAEPL